MSEASQRILDAAERLVQTRGFNGFSYADVAQELSVTKASLHYHFPSKAELGRALIDRYHVDFGEALTAINAKAQKPRKKVRSYIDLYDSVMRNTRMCLCGMLAAEYATLPEPMQAALRAFFDSNETWLMGVLDDGRRAGDLAFAGSARQRARSLIGSLGRRDARRARLRRRAQFSRHGNVATVGYYSGASQSRRWRSSAWLVGILNGGPSLTNPTIVYLYTDFYLYLLRFC